jgi:very-short-patch-repair endonuclease
MVKITKFDESDCNIDDKIDTFIQSFNNIFTDCTYRESYDKLPNNMFFNIKLFELINVSQCIHCKNNLYPIRIFGHCIKHFNLLNLILLGNEAKKQMELLNKSDNSDLYLSLATSILKLKKEKNLVKNIYKKNEYLHKNDKMICTKLMEKFGKYNKKFIKNNDILYDDLMKEYNKDYYLDINNLHTIDAENVKYNDNILNVLQFKQLRTEYYFIKHFFTNNKITNCHFDNSEYIYYKLLENDKLSACISNLELEKTFKIHDCSGKLHAYRVDLYLELKTFHKSLYKNIKNELIKVIIEIDESHHLTDKYIIINDINKDLYFIKNGFAIIRIDIARRKINDDDIKEVIRHLVEIQHSRNLRYVFSEAYIKSHDINNKITHNKPTKGIHITREQLLSVQ